MATKNERTQIFLDRLREAGPAETLDEACELIAATLNAVEDEFTDVAYDPGRWSSDGRLYPPQDDSRRIETTDPLVVRFRNRSHLTFVGENGAILITKGSEPCLDKPGLDGITIGTLMGPPQPKP